MPAGSTSLEFRWTSPYAANVEFDRGNYRLTIQAQPGMIPGPLTADYLCARRHPDNGRQPRACGQRGEGNADRDVRPGSGRWASLRTLTSLVRVSPNQSYPTLLGGPIRCGHRYRLRVAPSTCSP